MTRVLHLSLMMMVSRPCCIHVTLCIPWVVLVVVISVPQAELPLREKGLSGITRTSLLRVLAIRPVLKLAWHWTPVSIMTKVPAIVTLDVISSSCPLSISVS